MYQTEIEKAKLYEAQAAAVIVREVFAKLSPMERAAARMTQEYKAVEKLVAAVEAL